MNVKGTNRRKFLVRSLETAAGLGFMASCDKRTLVEPDSRLPAAPVGLVPDFDIDSQTNQISDVIISWDPHDLTDVNGAPLKTVNPNIQILGYNLYRTNDTNPPNSATVQPINGSSLITDTTFTDKNSITVGDGYYYWIEAKDSDNNISPLSAPLYVYIMSPSPVYVATNTNAVSNGTLVASEVSKTVNAAVLSVAQMTPPSTVGQAYESIFGGVTKDSMVGIKINTLAASQEDGLCTHTEVVNAIIEGLQLMLNGTFPANNIIVFDDRYWGPFGLDTMHRAGYKLQNDGISFRIASVNYNTTLHGLAVDQAETPSMLWADTYTISGVPIRLSSLIQGLDYIINVPVIKDHNDAGITFSLKNFFGTIDNPGGLHSGSLTPEMVGTEVPTVYQLVTRQLGALRNAPGRLTSILTIGDGFLGAYNGGPACTPSGGFVPCQVIAGTDPVATDAYVLTKLINPMRVANKKAPYSYGPSGAARHILTATRPEYNLGSIVPRVVSVPVV
jgi:uncharacterized protein (DUF362 family)